MNVQAIELDITKRKRVNTPVVIRQGDKLGTTVEATLYDGSQALDTTGLTAYIAFELPDGANYYRKRATLSGNVATVTIDETEAASVPGTTELACFQLFQGTEVIASTADFTIRILESPLDGKTPAESYDGAIEEALEEVREATDNATAAADSATGAAGRTEAAISGATAATAAATAAAKNANDAAEEARGSISENLRFVVGVRTFHDGTSRIALIDHGEE